MFETLLFFFKQKYIFFLETYLIVHCFSVHFYLRTLYQNIEAQITQKLRTVKNNDQAGCKDQRKLEG